MFSISFVGIFVYKDVIINDTIILSSDVDGKCGGVLSIVIFIFNISFQNVSCVFVKIV